jgi:hypothetical protein
LVSGGFERGFFPLLSADSIRRLHAPNRLVKRRERFLRPIVLCKEGSLLDFCGSDALNYPSFLKFKFSLSRHPSLPTRYPRIRRKKFSAHYSFVANRVFLGGLMQGFCVFSADASKRCYCRKLIEPPKWWRGETIPNESSKACY